MSFKVILKYSLAFFGGVVVTVLGQRIAKNLITYKVDENRVMLSSLREKLLEYKKSCGGFPSPDNGLKALVDPSIEKCSSKPLLPLVPVDPWDGEFIYLSKGEKAYLLSSIEEGSFVEVGPR